LREITRNSTTTNTTNNHNNNSATSLVLGPRAKKASLTKSQQIAGTSIFIIACIWTVLLSKYYYNHS
jgi:hypothetical protein